jgi:hypothetical protein
MNRGGGGGGGAGEGAEILRLKRTHTHTHKRACTNVTQKGIRRTSFIYMAEDHTGQPKPCTIHYSFKRLLIRVPNCTPYSKELIMDIFKLVICADWHKEICRFATAEWAQVTELQPPCFLSSDFVSIDLGHFGANCIASLMQIFFHFSLLHRKQLVLTW